MKSQNLKLLVVGSLLALAACGEDTSVSNVNGGNDSALSSGQDSGAAVVENPCEGKVTAIREDGSTYCVDESGVEIDAPASSASTAAAGGNGANSNTSSVADGAGNAANGENAASASSAGSNGGVPVVSGSSSSGAGTGATPASSATTSVVDYVSESNGNAPVITYTETGASMTNDNGCVAITGGEVVITCAGDYDFSGSYSGADAQIRVYSPKADSGVYLNLRGLTLENTVDAPIYVQMASKAFVVAKKETVNKLSDGSSRTKTFTYQNDKGETKTDTTAATIYSKDDLTIKGAGSLEVVGNANNGIHSANDLRFRGETVVTVKAKNNGVKGKGSVQIGSGTLTITTTEGDGIKSDECVENDAGECTEVVAEKGFIEITGGTINITAADDGIQAVNKIRINEADGSVNLKVKAGDGEPDVSKSNSFGPGGGNFGGMGGGNWGGGNFGGRAGNTGTTTTTTTTTDGEASNKGILSGDSIIIEAGTIEVASHKDAIHSNTYVDVHGGTFKLAGRNAIHADEVVTIHGGSILVTASFEAFEGRQVIAKGGVTATESSNDGWNAGTGNEGCTGDCKIEVTGGVHYMHIGSGDTDGMDSNESLFITGGVVVVECEMSGGMGGAFDAETRGTISLTSKTMLGFGNNNSEQGKNYTVSFATSGYYGTANIAFKPTFSGRVITTGGDQPSAVSDVSGYSNNTTLPNGLTIYYNN